ncbi:DMT family transporter [Peribacillus sp. Hz7]|uniref:DMT family transporter n=1 Tax=Peribacillus sp. Hz7 TaxID=3344873 RepID=UPI0035CC0D82
MGYLWLAIAIIAEVFGSSMLKLTGGFKKLVPTIGVIIGYGLAFFMLSKALAFLPLSLAYAIWSGVGTALTTILGILIFAEPFSLGVVLGISCIILGVVFMNTSKSGVH